MKDFFSTQPYAQNGQVVRTSCMGCDKEWDQCWPSRNPMKRFKKMTGLDWPGTRQFITLSLKKDLQSLKLNPMDIPQTINLCLPCSLDYMNSFNEQMNHLRAAGEPR